MPEYGLNEVKLIGRIYSDPRRHDKIRDTLAILKFVIKTVEPSYAAKGKVRGGNIVDYHRVAVFGGLATALSRFLQKDMLVYVSGRINSSTWKNREGYKQYSYEVNSNRVHVLGQPRDWDNGDNDKKQDKEGEEIIPPRDTKKDEKKERKKRFIDRYEDIKDDDSAREREDVDGMFEKTFPPPHVKE